MNDTDKEIITQIAISNGSNDNNDNILKNIAGNYINNILNKYKLLLKSKISKYIASWLVENDLWIDTEENALTPQTETLSRGRAVNVIIGVNGIGREQRFPHVYIVLGEYNDTFIGVPITNMAYDKINKKNYLRHYFEVELINPSYKKPFDQFRCKKPSVADVRNISGLDKRRIIKNQLYEDKKFVPQEYLDAISDKIRNSLALKNNGKSIDEKII